MAGPTHAPNRDEPVRPAEASARPRRATWRIDVSDAVDLPGRFEIATDVVAPAEIRPAPAPPVLCCLPGGFLSRKYFDLELAGDRRFSFAEFMARRGFVVLAFDPIGAGDSSKPDPIEGGYALGPEAIAHANQRALERALERLASGDEGASIPPMAARSTVGVGHSMGSALCVEQQAHARSHAALVLFSFGTAGLPDFLDAEQARYAHDPVRARADLGELVRKTMGSPYPAGPTGDEAGRQAAFGVGTAPRAALDALHGASTNLLALPGLLTMIPGGYAPPAQQIDVPVFVGVGDHDLVPARVVPPMLPNVTDLTLFTLEDCWHCHHVANPRRRLWHRVASWLDEVAADLDRS